MMHLLGRRENYIFFFVTYKSNFTSIFFCRRRQFRCRTQLFIHTQFFFSSLLRLSRIFFSCIHRRVHTKSEILFVKRIHIFQLMIRLFPFRG